MSDISTAASNVIPFDFRGHSVRAISLDGEPWFVAVDVCRVLGQSNTTKALYALDEDERSNFKLGRQGGVNIINESGLYTLILRCDDAIKKGSDAHAFRKWVTAEVLPAIRKHGHYADDSGEMGTLVSGVIGMTELATLKGVMADKAKSVAPEKRISFLHTMHHRLHTRFNVPKTELIQREHFADACNFVAAQPLEGEWLPKEEKAGTVLDDKQLYNVYFLRAHFKHLNDIFNRYKLYSHFSGIGSPVGAEMIDHFRDGHMAVHELGALEQEFDAVQRRLGLNKYRGEGLGLRATA